MAYECTKERRTPAENCLLNLMESGKLQWIRIKTRYTLTLDKLFSYKICLEQRPALEERCTVSTAGMLTVLL